MNNPADNKGNEPAKNTVLNTQSTKPVAGGATSKSDPDNTASKAAATDAKPAAGTGTDASDQAIENKARASELVGTSENDRARLKAEQDAEIDRLRKEKDGELSVEEQRELDRLHGDTNNAAIDPEADHRYLHADPHDKNDSLKKDLEVIRERDKDIHKRLGHFKDNYESAQAVITRIVRDVPADTPDEHIVWGASGHTLRFGHLRMLVMGK